MSPRALRSWSWAHKWSSLVCTLFMLLLCVTGAPLVFYDEIDHLAGARLEAPPMPAGTPRAPLDAVLAAATAHHPGKLPLYVFFEAEDPDLWLVKLDDRLDTDESRAVFAAVDARTAQVLGVPNFRDGVMFVLYRLHVDLFSGEPGRLFLGAMGLLLVISLVSGTVLYAPFMRRVPFGTVRDGRSSSLRWLDLHDLLGIVTLVWALVVGATGIVNTWANLILQSWRADQIAALKARPAEPGGAAPARALPVQRAVDQALAAHPGTRVEQLAMPGTLLAPPGHFLVLLAGATPLTARLTQPVLVAQASGRVIEAAPPPAMLRALQISQPLHFGDYGGLPLKLLWLGLDAATVVVLWSGLVLWWRKHRRPRAAPRPLGAMR